MGSEEMESVEAVNGNDPRRKIIELAVELTKNSQFYCSITELFRDSLRLYYGDNSIVTISIADNNKENRWKNWLPDMSALDESHKTAGHGYFTVCQTRRLLKINQQVMQYLIKQSYLDLVVRKNRVLIDQDSAFQVAIIKDYLVRRFKNKYHGQRLFNRLGAIKRAKKEKLQ